MQAEYRKQFDLLSKVPTDKLTTWWAENRPELSASDVGILSKVAKQCSYEEFENLVKHGEVPAVQLTASEMEKLKGGKNRPILREILKELLLLAAEVFL